VKRKSNSLAENGAHIVEECPSLSKRIRTALIRTLGVATRPALIVVIGLWELFVGSSSRPLSKPPVAESV